MTASNDPLDGKKPPWSRPDFWEERFSDQNTPWDIGAPSPNILDFEKLLNLPPNETNTLIPGCGAGHDVLALAEKGYPVSAVDFAGPPLDDLRVIAKRRKLPVEILKSDFFSIPTSWQGTFNLIVDHLFFPSLDPAARSEYVKCCFDLLKKDGILIGVSFDQAKGDQRKAPPFLVNEDELRGFLSPFFEVLELRPAVHQSNSLPFPQIQFCAKRLKSSEGF